MKTLVIILYIYLIINGGLTTYSCSKRTHISPSRNTKKIAGVIQIVSSMVFTVIVNQLFLQRTAVFWVAFVGIILLMVCGFINLISYMCSME